MQIVNMYKSIRPRRNSLPNSNGVHRSKTKTLPNASKVFHESKTSKSNTTDAFVKQLNFNYNELYSNGVRNNLMDHSLSDGDEISNDRTAFEKMLKPNQTTDDKTPRVLRSHPIDMSSKHVREVPLNHSPSSYESPQKYGQCKKFKKDNSIKQLVIEKYALLKQLMNIDERCVSPSGDNFYAGAKFSNCPSPRDLPLPPLQWLNTCQSQAKTMQNSHLIFNITI